MSDNDTTQKQARALGDPTRYRIYAHIAAAHEAVGVAELTDLLELNHNAVRQHLAKLVEAQLIVQSTEERTTRGRPRLLFSPDPRSVERWGIGGPYRRLSMMLLDAVTSGDAPEEVGHRTGRAIDLRPTKEADAIHTLGDTIARSGFDPSLRDVGGRQEFVLHNCSFADAAAVDPDTICDLHLGLARGVAEQLGSIEVDDLIRADPHRAGCRLTFHIVAEADQ